MRITIAGTGYVGLVSGVCLAAKGHHVTCVDVNQKIVDQLNRAVPHIYEIGLEDLLQSCVASGHFKATTDLQQALSTAEGVMIAVGTPSENGAIDLTFIKEVSRQIGTYIKTTDRFLPVIVKSTVIAGTTDTIVREEIEAESGKKHGAFGLGMNPEFLREGNAISDFMEPDRIVLGHEDAQTLDFLQNLYKPWNCDKLAVNTRTAEMIKYANNALLAVQISAVNEIANLAAALGGIDVLDVMKGVHMDKRWSPIRNGTRIQPEILSYLIPGCGFGGSCFPKDVQALRTQGENTGLPMAMMNAVLAINDAQPYEVSKVLERDNGSLKNKNCLVLGLAFKPDTDDVRESASIKIIDSLLNAGANVTAHDPIATEHFKRAFGAKSDKVTFTPDWHAALQSANIVIIATKWNDYRDLPKQNIAGKTIFDARRLIPANEVASGQYLSIGRRM